MCFSEDGELFPQLLLHGALYNVQKYYSTKKLMF